MSRLVGPSNRLVYTLSAGAAAFLLFTLLKPSSKPASCIRSPRETILPRLSQQELKDLPYPPDVLPGARDVETPYGTIKVFEWGPEDGRKVLFVHGISTPCIAFGAAAEKLVQRGCRVMLFDLFGRGYSDTPTDIPHDARLYTTQILLVLASSPLSWTGPESFDLIGYSFGGGISANFTRHFPQRVRSVILLAPGGIVRASHITWRSKILYSTGIFPEWLLQYLVLRRLRPGNWPSQQAPGAETAERHVPAERGGKGSSTAVGAEEAVSAEVGRATSRDDGGADSECQNGVQALPHRPTVNPDLAIAWQIEHHAGFIAALMSSIRNGPIHNQHADWALLGQVMARRREAWTSGGKARLMDKVLLVLGAADPIVLKGEVADDAREVLGKDNVHVALVDGGHEFPMTESGQLVDAISNFWAGDKEPLLPV